MDDNSTHRRQALVSLTAVVVLVAAAVAFAATRDTPDASAARATPTTVARAAQLVAEPGCSRQGTARTGPADGPRPRAAVRTFRTVAVLGCNAGQQRYADGVWSVMRTQVAVTRLQPLLDGLDRPDSLPRTGPCIALLEGDPALYLLDAHGGLLRPHFPRDECNLLRGTPARHAYDRLQWHTVKTVRLYLDVPDDPVARVCGASWKDMTSYGPGRAGLAPAGRLLLRTGTIACVYRHDGDPLAGAYVDGRRLARPDAAALGIALGGAGRIGNCPLAPRFAVLHSGADLMYVELGGCYRVLRRDGRLGRADPAAVRAVFG